MKPARHRRRWATARRGVRVFSALLIACAAARALAYPPRQPLPIPFFTFDAQSPSVNNQPPPPDPVHADSVLGQGNPMDPSAVTVIPGVNIGLGQEGDELDGMSFNRSSTIRTTQFVLLFSVGRDTTGEVPPDGLLVANNVPFNVSDQVVRGHAPGDGFISVVAFDTNGTTRSLRGTGGNVQVINNYDEGGVDYNALPPTSSKDFVPLATLKDNVNGTTYPPTTPSRSRAGAPGSGQPGLYFTVTAESPSLSGGQLPGDSGADIFFDPQPSVPGLQRTFPYASASMLGLRQDDDISALVVDDGNSNGVFDGDDCVYLSLRPGSASLALLPFLSSNGAADVLVACADPFGAPDLSPLVYSSDLGLLGPGDDIDALEVARCGSESSPCDPLTFANDSGIRLFKGDWNNNGEIESGDAAVIPFCLSGPWQGADFVPPSPLCRDIFDMNEDTDVDLADFGFFQVIFDSTPSK